MNVSSYKCCSKNSIESKQLSALSDLLKLVGEENRLKLLCLLRQDEHCVCEIIEELKLSQSLISHHLADLKEAGLIIDRKQGRQVHYSLTTKGQKLIKNIFSLREEIL